MEYNGRRIKTDKKGSDQAKTGKNDFQKESFTSLDYFPWEPYISHFSVIAHSSC